MLRKSFGLLERLPDRKLALVRSAALRRGQDDRSLVRAATAAQAAQEWQRAHDLWAEASQRFPDDINCLLQLANMLNELGRHEEAASTFQKARGVDPEAAEPLEGLAGVHERSAAWNHALAAWTDLLKLLRNPSRKQRASDTGHLSHAYLHAALSASMCGRAQLARELMLEGARQVPGFDDQPGHLLLRARMIRDVAPPRALAMLRNYLERAPEDDAARFEFGSIALDHGDLAEASDVVSDALVRRPRDVSFLWLLADLRDRLRDWKSVRALSEKMAEIAPGDPRYLRRALAAALGMRDLVAARRLARAAVRSDPGELMALHELAHAYEAAEEYHHARLLFRFLHRKWPHSHWHAAKVVILTGGRYSLSEADRLLRSHMAVHGRSIDFDRAYYDAAFSSGNYAETVRRLEWFIAQHPDDESAPLFLGYVIANARGLADAEEHFADLATRTFQSKGALVGLAHMAMRRRETHRVHERWANVVGIYPEDTIGRVELARSAYEIRQTDMALELCETQLRRLPADVTMGQFYAWLLTAIGRFGDAWVYLETLRKLGGADWFVLELSVRNAAETGNLETAFGTLLDFIPQGGTIADGRRCYHVLRQLFSARRSDLIPALVRQTALDPRNVPWLSPYLRSYPAPDAPVDPPFVEQIDAAWSRARGLVRAEIADRLAAMDDVAVAALLDQAPSAFPTVHIVNKFEQTRGGSELHALDLAERLRRHAKVELWAPEMPHPHFSSALGVRAIEPGQGHVPHGGVLVIIGVYFGIASWIRRARPRRVIFLYNTFEAPLLFERVRETYEQTGVRCELVYCSDMMAQEVDLPGLFEPSPVDTVLFRPRDEARPEGHRFTVGRHSRDVIEKHHPEDWKVYEAVAASGGQSRLLGGTCMADVFPALGRTEFLPPRSDRIVEFLQDIDCFYYNTSTWIEPWGRVVIEAMACGLPVLVSDVGGYAQAIEHGRNGLVFRDMEEAVRLMQQLAADPELRARLGGEARRSVEKLLGAPALARLAAFYLMLD